jgi:hypothetical protein
MNSKQLAQKFAEQALPCDKDCSKRLYGSDNHFIECVTNHRPAVAAAVLPLIEALMAVDNLCGQIYRCAYGSSEYAHVDPDEYKEAADKARAVLAGLEEGK